MMSSPSRGLAAAALVVVLGLIVGGSTAVAGTWSDKINYRHSAQTSLKVVEPDGFKVTVTLGDGSELVGTAPELFRLPDQDAFVKVTITPGDGSAPWSKKIEVRSRQQAELAVSFKPDAPQAEPAKAAAARTYVGRFANKAGGCGKAWSRTIRVEFLRTADGSAVKEVQIDSAANSDLKLPAGAFDVRVFIWNDKEWKFVLTSNHEIGKDGWTLGFGCPVGKNTPAIIGA